MVFVDQRSIPVRLLESGQVLSLEVFDQCDLESLLVGDGQLDARDLGQIRAAMAA